MTTRQTAQMLRFTQHDMVAAYLICQSSITAFLHHDFLLCVSQEQYMAFHGMRGDSLRSYLEEQKRRGRKTDTRTLRRIAEAFAPYKFQVLLVLLAIILTTGLGLVNPLLIAVVFDDAIGKHNLHLVCHADHYRHYRRRANVPQ